MAQAASADPWGAGDTGDTSPQDPWSAGPAQSGWSLDEDSAHEAILGIAPGATITSQTRTPDHNDQVGGVADSMHLSGHAADVVLPKGISAAQFRAQLQAQGYPVTEFLDEGDHVHWGWGPKGSQTGVVANDPWGPAQAASAPQDDGHWHHTPQENAGMDAFEQASAESPPLPDSWYPHTGSEKPPKYDATNPDFEPGDFARAAKFYGGVWTGLKAAASSTWPIFKREAGAAIQLMGEQGGPQALRFSDTPNEATVYGQKLYADAQAQVAANAPGVGAGPQGQLAYQIATGTIEMLPVLAATAATKSAAPGMAMMGNQAAAEKYGEARAAGRTPNQAAMDASFSGMVNGTLGGLPLGALMKPGQGFLAKTLQGAGTFGAVSVVTEALQIGYDKGLVNPAMSLKEAWGRLEQAGIVGTLQGAFLGGGHSALETAVSRLHAQTPAAPQERIEPAAASTTPPPPPPPPASPSTTVHADVRRSLGLETPGVAPQVDAWAPTPEPITAAPAPAPQRPTAESALPQSEGIPRRSLEPDVAVTASGREVPVTYAIVDAAHLVPSQTAEGNLNPHFPQDLQPRDRTRVASQAQIAAIAQNINPRLLDRSVNASDGAPIVAPSGIVESGNGRTLAVQRAYAEDMPSARTYRDYLAAQGYPVEGLEAPMLVRIRSGDMTPEERQSFVREANQPSQLGYSATERAMADAAAMPDHALELFRGGDVETAQNRDFVRAFMSHALPTTEHGAMVDSNGNLSLEGARRLRSALLAKAYSDPDVVGAIVENSDSGIKAIGNALTDSAADWALMRSAAAKGEIPPSLDQTSKLLEAVQLVARARQDGRNVAEFVAQPDIFTGQAIDPDVESWLRLMFRNTRDWTQPVSRDKLAAALQFYAREARKASVGPNLLGQEPVAAADVLAAAKRRQYGESASDQGPSLSLGQDLRTYGEGRAGRDAQTPAAGGSQGAAAPGVEGPAKGAVEGPFGPQPQHPFFREPQTGGRTELAVEAQIFLKEAGIDPADRPQTLAGLANYVYLRGLRFGFETLGAVTSDGRVRAGTDAKRGAVTFSDMLEHELRDPTQQILTVHNHPSSSAFSQGDIASLGYPGHAAMAVVGHDGEFHLAVLAAERSGADWSTHAAILGEAQRRARSVGTRFVDPLFRARTLSADEADNLLSHITMHTLDQAGIIRYIGPDRVPAYLAKEVEHVIAESAQRIRTAVGARADGGLKPSQDVHRPARALPLAQQLEGILGQPSGDAGQPGSAGGTPAGRSGPQVYRRPEQLKLLEDENRYERERPPFYSALTRAIEDSKLSRAPAKDWAGLIDNLRAKGVKQEEIDWSGVKDWLAGQKGPVTKAALMDHLRENEVRVQEVEKGTGPAVERQRALAKAEDNWVSHMLAQGFTERDARDFGLDAARGNLSEGQKRNMSPEELRLAEEYRRAYEARKSGGEGKPTKFDSYTLPGGENYRELLLTLPENGEKFDPEKVEIKRNLRSTTQGDTSVWYDGKKLGSFNDDPQIGPDRQYHQRPDSYWMDYAKSVYEKGSKLNGIEPLSGGFRSGHWDEPNILAHVRFDDRTGPNGEKILHLAEIQSDWGQRLRKSSALRAVAKPQSVRELSENVLGREMASAVPLEHMNGGVLAALHHDQVARAVAASLPVDVVNDLRAAKSSPEELFRNPDVVIARVPADHRGRVARAVLSGARRVSATLRTKLYESFAAGRDEEILPAMRASDLSAREVVGLLAPESIYHAGLHGGAANLRETSAGAENSPPSSGIGREHPKQLPATEAAFLNTPLSARRATETGGSGPARLNGEVRPASIASLLDWHNRIISEAGTGKPVRYDATDLPKMPLEKNWHELALKRTLRYAAEHGYDRLSWDTGETNAERYDLSKSIGQIRAGRMQSPDHYWIEADRKGYPERDNVISKKGLTAADLENTVGKDVAKKILDKIEENENTPPDRVKKEFVRLSGLDLKVGGEGMRGFYDRILPAAANKLGKKFGAKVEPGTVSSGGEPAWKYEGPDAALEQVQEAYKASLARGQVWESPITGERQGYQVNRVANASALKGVLGEMTANGTSFADAMRSHGSADVAKLFGGDMAKDKTPVGGAPAHSIAITPAMREGVMQGQALFENRRRYAEEPGATDAKGTPVPQTVMPGMEQSALQLARARDAANAGRKGPKVAQQEPGGLFAEKPNDKQLTLFEDERRYAEIPGGERTILEKAARTGNWVGKYQAEGATSEAKIRAAIGGAFQAWRRSAASVPEAVRGIFKKLPQGFSEQLPTTRPTERFKDRVRDAAANVMDFVHDAQMLIAPMAEGSSEARAHAKDFANMMRLARWHGQRMMDGLKKGFAPDQLRRMWDAADEESVLRQEGQPTAGKGLSKLAPDERRAVLEQQTDAQAVWDAAKDQGMVEGEGLPSYVPRMMVEMGEAGAVRLGDGEGVRSIPGIGRNLKTTTPQMKGRKYLTTEETERAGSQKFGTIANVVKDIRTLPLATMRLREAVAGRALINKIKEIGRKTGEDTVVEGHEPAGTPYKWFTLDHPAFKTWRPKLVKNEETGKYEAAKDQNGEPMWERVPLYVRSDFEGPLKAVLSQDSGKVYNGLMGLKGRAMTAIMYSPLIHNAVEWGRALPAMPGKVVSLRIYFEGNRAKNDPAIMTEAIMHGMVPIGHRAGYQDQTSIANVDNVRAGRSWTAKILGAVPGLFSPDAREAVYRTVDRLGDLWHNTLLWDRVGDLQMGLYVNLRDRMIAHGNAPEAAQYVAAHFANRYAGALPLEAMSNMSRKIANLALFSRTYTLGNLGAMKDVVTGLPRDVQAQIERSGTFQQLKGVRSMAARKAIAILATDIALFYAGNSILQSAVSYLSGRQDLDEIEKGYVDRLHGLLQRGVESPLELLNPFADLQALSATSENEPGRQNRVLAGYDHNGTAIYARNPVGKIGEEFTNWLTSPLTTVKNKFSTVLRPTYQVITNDAGFGRHVYDPDAKGVGGLVSNLGKVVSLYLESQVPIDSLKSTAKVLKGEGSEIDTYKAVGPLAGVTFSKGAPGGPGVGELYQLQHERDAKVQAAMPAITEKIKTGDIAGARADMRALGISPGLQNYYVRTTLNPRLRLQTRKSRELLRQATPEERSRILQPSGR